MEEEEEKKSQAEKVSPSWSSPAPSEQANTLKTALTTVAAAGLLLGLPSTVNTICYGQLAPADATGTRCNSTFRLMWHGGGAVSHCGQKWQEIGEIREGLRDDGQMLT